MYTTDGLGASNYVSSYNLAFYFILIVSLILLLGLTGTMIYFVFRYNRKKNPKATQIEGNLTLEILWTVIPVLLALVMFYFGWEGWKPVYRPPKDTMKVTAIARMWNFSFTYDNGKQSPQLLVPVHKAVKVNLISLDVIHSLFIPDFRIKTDIVPGREKFMWFRPDIVGTYHVFCAEYCGLQHSYMSSSVKVLSQADFDKWYIDTTKTSMAATGGGPAAEGEAIMKTAGCFACHSTDGSKLVGPSYLNLWGSQQVVLRGGKEVTVKVDEDYVKRSILDPAADITKGYPNVMTSFKGTLNDQDISKIIEFLKTLHE